MFGSQFPSKDGTTGVDGPHEQYSLIEDNLTQSNPNSNFSAASYRIPPDCGACTYIRNRGNGACTKSESKVHFFWLQKIWPVSYISACTYRDPKIFYYCGGCTYTKFRKWKKNRCSKFEFRILIIYL